MGSPNESHRQPAGGRGLKATSVVQRDRQCVRAYTITIVIYYRAGKYESLRESEMHVICDPSILWVPRADRSLSRTYEQTGGRTDSRAQRCMDGPPPLPPRLPPHHLLLPDFAAIFFSLSRTIPLLRFLPPANTFSFFSNPTSPSTPPARDTRPLSSHKARLTCRRNAKIKSLTCLG